MNRQAALFHDDETTIATMQSTDINFAFPQDMSMRMGRAVTMLTRYVDHALPQRRYMPISYVPFVEKQGVHYGAIHDEMVWSAFAQDVRTQFEELANHWIEATRVESSFLRMFNHEAYLELLTLGRDAIPHLLARLDDEPERWVGALRIITREAVGTDASSADEGVEAWRTWGRAHGYWK